MPKPKSSLSKSKVNKRAGISSFEFLLIAATLSLAALIIVPSALRVRDEVAIERTARTLADVNAYAKAIERAARTLTDEDVYAKTNAVAFDASVDRWSWPPQVKQSSFAYDTTNGASVMVSLKSGDRRVTAEDVSGLK